MPFRQVARQIGNALPPLMARAFAVEIGAALGHPVEDELALAWPGAG